MWRAFAIVTLAAALGGCLTPSAFHQSSELIGQPLTAAVERYGPPDQPIGGGARSYSWSGGRLTGACKLNVRTDAAGRIAKASVVAVGFETCRSVLRHERAASAPERAS